MFCHLCNKVLDIDNLVSVFYLFLFSLLKSLGHEKMSFSMVYIFFRPQITIACENCTSPVNRKSTD